MAARSPMVRSLRWVVGQYGAVQQQSRGMATSSAPKRKVALLGAAGGVGQPVGLLMMKLNPLVAHLAHYSVVGTPGAAVDVSNVNSPAKIPASRSVVSEEDRLRSLADLRRKYEQQISVLRKKYAADIHAKRLQKKEIEEEQRKEIEEQKAVRAVAKKERIAARAIEVAEEEKELQAFMKEQREESARQRARVEGRQGYIRFKRVEAIRRQSSMWIEPKDLERRILEAIANPYHLAGSVGVESHDRDDSFYEADEA